MTNYPLVTVVVLCRNEHAYIGVCLDSLLANDYPKDKMEILVVDGMSSDGTREIVEDYTKKHSVIRLIDNLKRDATSAMNIGVRDSQGQVVAIVGSHTTYANDYFSRCVRALSEYGADNVGGIMNTLPRSDTLVAKAIATAMSHPFGTGNAYFRAGVKEPRLVDTVFGGCYKRGVFDRIGLFNEDLSRSQDMEFNIRLKQAGGKILLDPRIKCNYYARSTLGDFARHVFDDGKWSIYPLKFGAVPFYPRHMVPLAFVSSLGISLLLAPFLELFRIAFLGIVGIYMSTIFFFSVSIAVEKREPRYVLLMPVAFATRHFAHGLGAFYGLFLTVVSEQFWRTSWQRLWFRK